MPLNLGPIGSFIERLFPHAMGLAGYLSLWDRQTKASIHVPVMDLLAIEIRAQEIDAKGHDAYFGVGLRTGDLGPSRRGGRADVMCLPGFWVDLDIKSPVHSADNLPDFDSACEILSQFPFAPTDVIHSGYGMHCWWLFDKPLVFTAKDTYPVQIRAKSFQDAFIKLFKEKNFHVDVTSDLARVLRPPGTRNFKVGDQPQPVRVLLSDAHRYKYDDLDLRPKIIQTIAESPVTGKPTPSGLTPIEHVKFVLLQAKKFETRAMFEKIAKGESFAPEGQRDIALQKAASAIAFVDCHTDPETLAELLRPSLTTMAGEATNTKNPPPTLDQAVDKIARAQQDALRSRAKDEAIKAVLVRSARQQPRPPSADRGSDGDVSAATSLEGSGSVADGGRPIESPSEAPSDGAAPDDAAPYYTDDEIIEWCKQQKCTPVEMMQRWVIQNRNRFFIYVDGHYKTSIVKEELEHSLPRDLSPLGERIQWNVMKQNGEIRPKKPDELLKGICTVARSACFDLTIEKSFYDAGEQRFHEAVCSQRKNLQPVFNEKVQKWLEKLGGDNHGKLLDWLATVTMLDKQTCAIYLSGPPSTGKTMLAVAVSRIWTTGAPTELTRILDNFNADLLRCPLIFADEYIPQGHKVSSELRSMIAASQRTISKKFIDNADMIGAIRMMLCSNNNNLIQFDEELGEHDQEALATRFLHIEVSDEARTYLNELGGRSGTDGWVDKDIIAQHVLWLTQNRVVVPGKRFLVEGFQSEMHQSLSITSRNPSLVCEWIVRHMMEPKRLDPKAQKLVRIGDGKILINTNVLIDFWKKYMEHERFSPSLRKIANALSNLRICEERRNIMVGNREEKLRYHSINPKLILAWCEQNQVGDPEVIMAMVSGPTADIVEEIPVIN